MEQEHVPTSADGWPVAAGFDVRVAEDDGCLLAQVLLKQALSADPGTHTPALLSLIDLDSLSEGQRAHLAHAWERQVAWTISQQNTVLATFAADDSDLDDRLVAMELATSFGVSEFAAQRKLDTARSLGTRLGQCRALLEEGRWTLQHAAAVSDETIALTDEQACWVDREVRNAWDDGKVRTPAQVRRLAKRAAMTVDCHREEQAQAAAEKCVEVAKFSDGGPLVDVSARLLATDAQVVWKALTAHGRKLRRQARTADPETVPPRQDLAYWRARALVDMADQMLEDPQMATFQGKRRVEVGVVINLDTLLKLNDDPAELLEHGPVPASVARELAGDGKWRRWIAEPVTGHLLDYGRTTYRPPQELVEYLLARDTHCVFPGCSMPAWRCELDHVNEWSRGGKTAARCMQSLCTKHHGKRTCGNWGVRILPDGATEWTSWSGTTHIVPPRAVLPEFSPPPDPDSVSGTDAGEQTPPEPLPDDPPF